MAQGKQNLPSTTEPMGISPDKGIQFLRSAIKKAEKLQTSRPISSDDYSSWEQFTRNCLEEVFGKRSHNVSNVMNVGKFLFYKNRSESWRENHRAESLKTQKKLLEAQVEFLETSIQSENGTPATNSHIVTEHTNFPVHGHDERVLHVPIEKNYVFIIMAMIEGDPQLIDIHETISETCKSLNLKGERVDQIEHTGRITDKIIECINKAEIVIADLTHNRPNCYYEAGYAHGIGKNVVFTAREKTELQFDLKDYPVIFYPNMSILKKKLLKRLKVIKG